VSEGSEPGGTGTVHGAADAAQHAEEMVDDRAHGLETARRDTLQRRRTMVRLIQGQGLVLVLVALIVIFWSSSPYFMNVPNWTVIAQLSAILGILAVSQTLLVLSEGIDISVGSTVACSSAVLGWLVLHHASTFEALMVVLVGGCLVGLVNGSIVVGLKVNPLVTTLGMYSILLGASYTIIGTASIPVSSGLFRFLAGRIAGFPTAFVMFVVIWVVALAVSRGTAVGRHIYAIGDNEEAAARAGINTRRIKISLFVLSGLFAAFAGVLTTAQLSTASPQIGASYLLSVVTAVVLGGTRLQGGRGGLLGTLIAVAILGVLQNGFALLQVNAFAQDIVQGILLILAVLVDQTTTRLERG
jgi:ribose/xylose/arabinose/galactoside ABC-type transport system permease subunit